MPDPDPDAPNPKDERDKPDPESKPDPEPAEEKLGDAGKAALDRERKARREAEKQLTELQKRLKEIEDKDLSEVDKLRKQVAELTSERDGHALKALRLEVAAAKGLSPAQAKRLVGSTKEELEADADEILEAFPAKNGATPPPTNKPSPSLRGGNDPTEEPDELDPKKLAEFIPRP